MVWIRGRHAKVLLLGKFAIKIFNDNVKDNAKKEFNMLKKLKPYNIAPKPYFWIGNIVVMERLRGKSWSEMSKEERKNYFIKFMDILYLLDKLNINKEECHKPDKHFILTKDNYLKLIDFERAVEKEKPSNVTQFISRFFSDDEEVIAAARKYKNGEIKYKELRDLISNKLRDPSILARL